MNLLVFQYYIHGNVANEWVAITFCRDIHGESQPHKLGQLQRYIHQLCQTFLSRVEVGFDSKHTKTIHVPIEQ